MTNNNQTWVPAPKGDTTFMVRNKINGVWLNPDEKVSWAISDGGSCTGYTISRKEKIRNEPARTTLAK